MTPQEAQRLARHLDRLVRRLNAALHPRAEAMDTDKIGPLGGMVLMTLAEKGALPIAHLTAEMGRDKSQMTRLVQMLERKAFISRAAHPDDGRVSVVALTPQGQRFVGDVEGLLAEILGDLLAPLDDAERRTLMETLSKI